MSVPIFPNMPAKLFPFTLEAFHPATGAIVWTRTVERPPAGELISVEIPPLARIHGFRVGMRACWADGTKTESYQQ